MTSHIVWITWQEHTSRHDRTVVTDHAYPVHCERHHQAVDTLTAINRDPRLAMTQRGLPATTAHNPQADLQTVTGCHACNRTRNTRITAPRPTSYAH